MTRFIHRSLKQQVTNRGFTIVELIMVVVVIAILAAIVIVAYNGSQRRAMDGQVQQTISDARKSLQVYYAFNNNYPPNIANTEYAPPLTVAVVLYTDAPQLPIYSGLSTSQNAQLFLNACNGFMPIVDNGTTYNTSCVYNGNNEHIKGTQSSNVVIHGPIINESDFVLTCGGACTATQNNIISIFKAQGGSFPVTVPKKGSTLPSPTSLATTGPASDYCLEGRAPQFSDVIYHATPDEAVTKGPCPTTPTLHYP